MANQKVGISLRNFYIFNSNLCEKEGEESKKILFYYPVDIDLDTKIKDVGLSEAIIKFSGTFTTDEFCKALHTQKTTQIYNLPEKNFWTVMTINVPYETKVKDNSEYCIEYKGGEIQDKIFRYVLKQAYNIFRLFVGKFESNMNGNSTEEKIINLKKKLENFYSKYLLSLKLNSCDITDICKTVPELGVEKILFLRVYNLITLITEQFKIIEKCIFLYNDQVVWCEINAIDLYSIYEYLVSTLIPKATLNELRGGSMKRSYSLDITTHTYGSYISASEVFDNCVKAPKIHIFEEINKESCYYLVVYRSLNATLCLLIKEEEISKANDDFYIELQTFMGPLISNIASDIGDSFAKPLISIGKQSVSSFTSSLATTISTSSGLTLDVLDNTPKFLFYNEITQRHKATIYFDSRRPKNSLLPRVAMNLLADLHKANTNNTSEEYAIKSINDFWIVKRASNWRNIYVIINNSKGTLLDVTNEARKIIEQETKNLFFLNI